MAKVDPDLKTLIRNLMKQATVCSDMCTSTTEFNALAYVLLTRSLDILDAVHGEDTFYQLQAVLHDRQIKRRLPTTVEHAKKQQAMKKFLP